ncbi:5'-AMP-activated protein kinase subunit beta-2 [Homalodisca vitripennis]|nr:5'-AMP-activated protein kinase subunit beta-2 [Homalodisca vitripennis]
MGNAGSGPNRDRQKAGESNAPHSPSKEEQAFVFDKKPNNKLVFQSSHDEEEPYFTKERDSSVSSSMLTTESSLFETSMSKKKNPEPEN